MILSNMPLTIIIAPLNWGLGHATRSMPIINSAIRAGHRVILASDGAALHLLRSEYPDLPYLEIPSYNITYPKNGKFVLHMAAKIPSILRSIRKEKKWLQKIIANHKPDIVISDNRYGLHHPEVKSIFITHQLQIKIPFAKAIVTSAVKRLVKGFDEIWIPDIHNTPNLSGDLARIPMYPVPVRYIGWLSRFSYEVADTPPSGLTSTKEFTLVVLSGPEPQRSIFEKLILKQAKTLHTTVVIVGGNPEGKEISVINNVVHFPFLNTPQLLWLLQHSSTLVVRSGYSTLMDLVTIQKPAIVVPTPGQTEQEYLADLHSNTKMFYPMKQSDFQLKKAVKIYPSLRIHKIFKNIMKPSILPDIIKNI